MSDSEKILIAGSSGFIGSALAKRLLSSGYSVFSLVRRAPKTPYEIEWSPDKGFIDKEAIESFDYVINLAGSNIGRRWSKLVKNEILKSRVESSALIAHALASSKKKPKAFLNGSAIGFYGINAGNRICVEEMPAGDGFLADVCAAWEKSVKPLLSSSVRVVNLRTGLVLSPEGGSLKKMLLPFRLGLGGRLGTGTQYMSWISLSDYLSAVECILRNDQIAGPVNMVAPFPVTNIEFTNALAAVLHRPAVIPVPEFALRIMLGEFADEALLSSIRAYPSVLTKAEFQWKHSTLKEAFRFYEDTLRS